MTSPLPEGVLYQLSYIGPNRSCLLFSPFANSSGQAVSSRQPILRRRSRSRAARIRRTTDFTANNARISSVPAPNLWGRLSWSTPALPARRSDHRDGQAIHRDRVHQTRRSQPDGGGRGSNLRTSLGGQTLQSVGFNHSPTCARTMHLRSFATFPKKARSGAFASRLPLRSRLLDGSTFPGEFGRRAPVRQTRPRPPDNVHGNPQTKPQPQLFATQGNQGSRTRLPRRSLNVIFRSLITTRRKRSEWSAFWKNPLRRYRVRTAGNTSR